jgi:hypothetical protein
MYEWTEPYEDEYIKERIEEIREAEKDAIQNGKILVSSYEQFWLPVLNEMPDVEYIGRQMHCAHYGTFEAAPKVPFHGALWFTPDIGAELPSPLKDLKEWVPAEASVDMNGRTVKILAQDMEITFTNINVSLNARELLDEINRELVRANACAKPKTIGLFIRIFH